MNKTFLIAINSYGRDVKEITPTLEGITHSIKDQFEIFFIDQNEKKLALPSHMPITHHHFPNKSLSSARNQVLAKSKNFDWITFIDDDGVINKEYFSNLVSLINQKPTISIWAGTIKTPQGKLYSLRQKNEGPIEKLWQIKKVMGGNFSIKSELFFKLHGFDERFGIGSTFQSSEETELILRAYRQKIEIYLSKDLVLIHPEPTQMSHQKVINYGIGKGALVSKSIKLHFVFFTYELIEMITIPLAKTLISLIKFDFKNSFQNILRIFSRIFGLIYYLFKGNPN